jgi:hypothetical protein
MNSDPDSNDQTSARADSPTPEADLSCQTQASAGCRRNGNIARLPKAVRDKINLMIQDGVPYSAIIKLLGEDGKGLCPSNFTHWKDGGYKDWLNDSENCSRQVAPDCFVQPFA